MPQSARLQAYDGNARHSLRPRQYPFEELGAASAVLHDPIHRHLCLLSAMRLDQELHMAPDTAPQICLCVRRGIGVTCERLLAQYFLERLNGASITLASPIHHNL